MQQYSVREAAERKGANFNVHKACNRIVQDPCVLLLTVLYSSRLMIR